MPLEDGLPQLGDAEEERHPVREFGVPRRRIEGKTPPEALRALRAEFQELDLWEEAYSAGSEFYMEEARIREVLEPGESTNFHMADEVAWELKRLHASLSTLAGNQNEQVKDGCLQEALWPQTVTVSAADVRRELGDWKAAIKAEYDSLLSTGTVRKAGKNEVKELEVVPGKAVCTRKSPDGRHKVRGVICGNYMQERPAEEVYASGIDVGAVRSLIRHAALERWSLVTVDVKTAFLQVPQEERKDVTVVNPPRLFQDAGVTAAGEQWIVQGTLYGTITAPKEWGAYRDRMMAEMVWGEQGEWRLVNLPEANVWAIEKKVKGTGVVQTWRCTSMT